ncbi:MAG TPA: aminotransferase class I/II-fold pyridoxal phosphate-dependent enzyme [Bryobacteraceae bacterium]|nr:aminotransferase class I/II-fold pyridoxal phosphate-dependent enzyme [Bryobacteraceae bacterium]
MPNRRSFLRTLSSVPVLGSAAATRPLAAAVTHRDYFKELGVRTFINAAGTYTMFTGSLMWPETVHAIEACSKQYCSLVDLHRAAGKRIAELVKSEAALVTAGAASALTLGTAACVTGTDRELIERLPDTTGMKSEVIIQKSHRYGYDHSVRACGIKMVEVETAADLEAAVNSRTAMMLFFNANDPLGQIKRAEFVALGKKHGIPTFIDAAADVPPVENLWNYTQMGFDLVTFSGGKGIRGPQSAGLLLGRKDLIEAALLHSSPNDTIARGQKVNKEEIVGMMVAVETFVHRDHEADWKDWEKRTRVIADSVHGIKSVSTETWIPEIANHVPHLKVRWDPEVVKISVREVVKRLREGEPSIEVVPGSSTELTIGVWMMQPGEAQTVARRVREVLQSAT